MRYLFALVVFQLLLSGGIAYAQNESIARSESILFEEIPSVFGASKYEQRLEEAPSAVTIITAEEIKKYGYRTLADILRSQRGVYVTYDRNYTYVGVRGFSRPTDYNSRVLVMVDGHRTNETIFHMAMLGTEGILDVELIDHIELIRGPSSSLYGTHALFAAINIITKRGRDYQGAELAGEVGSLSSRKGRATYGIRTGDGTEVLASISAYRSAGNTRVYFPEFDDPSSNNGVAENNDAEQARKAFFKLASGDLSIEAGGFRREKEVPTASWGAAFNHPDQGTLDWQGFIAAAYDTEIDAQSQLSARLSYDQYRYDGTYASSTTPPDLLFQDYGDGRWWTAQLQYTAKMSESHRVIAGTEYQYNARQNQGGYDADPYVVIFTDERASHNWSVFAQDEWRIRETLILNAGIRHDRYSDWGSTTNPRLALIYSSSSVTTLKLLYGQAFRAPSPYESYYPPGSPGLNPEEIRTTELVVEHTLRDQLRVVASLYQYRVNDLINQQNDFSFANTGSAEARGFELELEGRVSTWLDGRMSYSQQQARDEDSDTTLSNSPQRLVKLNLSVPLFENRLSTGLDIQYVSTRKSLANANVDGYVMTNLTLLGRRWAKGFETSVSVYNLADVSFADPGGQEHLQDSLAQDGRSYRFTVQYELAN